MTEVAGDSPRLDRQTKAALYARAAISEYWIVNLGAASIEVHRDPDPASGSYRKIIQCQRGDTLEAQALPGFRLDLRSCSADPGPERYGRVFKP